MPTLRSLLGSLLTTTVLVTAALGWLGWRVLDQQQAIEEQRTREQADSAADAIASHIRGQLAEAGELLSGWLSSAAAVAPSIDNAVLVAIREAGTVTSPPGDVPFVPVVMERTAPVSVFAAAESAEFSGADARAVSETYRALSQHADPRIRAGALLRLARVMRRQQDLAGALKAYMTLTQLGAVRTDDLPAELIGLDGHRAVARALGDLAGERALAARLLDGLDGGRWRITRGQAEFYRDGLTSEPPPDSWRLAGAVTDVWQSAKGALPGRGQTVVMTDGRGVLVLWRSTADGTAVLAGWSDQFFQSASSGSVQWQLSAARGQRLSGADEAPPNAATRDLGDADSPWTLRTWVPAQSVVPYNRLFVLGSLSAMLLFLWTLTYLMARAIRREATVARLQSDFVAAVSHEFRSPLTTVRQMAEMLERGDLPAARQQTYYRVLVAEATRLQRLVETLLNFGQMEAGATQYHFAPVDPAALVRAVASDVAAQAHASGKQIEVRGDDSGVRVMADENALSVAVRNLLDNAIKYSPNQPTVWIESKAEAGRAAISVIDRGLGIARAEQDAVFGKFVRGRDAIARNLKGTGVGLSMVRHIVAAHGGEVRLTSAPGEGSTFTVLLPAASPEGD